MHFTFDSFRSFFLLLFMLSSLTKDAPAQTVNPGLDTTLLEKTLGMKGKFMNGEYKITIAQNDLNVEVDGFRIIAPMGLGTWIVFAPGPGGCMIMGDLVLTETDLKTVQQEVIHQGITITAIHNHFVRNHPNILYMHIDGMGSTGAMAQKAKSILDRIKESRGMDPAKGSSASEVVANSIDVNELNTILGAKPEIARGVIKYTIGRPDVSLTEHGVPISSFMGFNTWAAFQGSPDKAAVAGDFTMLEDEVAPVIKTLVENNIEVVAVHNHMVQEKPKIFFLHYWGTGNAGQLAKALKAALDQTGKNRKMDPAMKMSSN